MLQEAALEQTLQLVTNRAAGAAKVSRLCAKLAAAASGRNSQKSAFMTCTN